MATAIEALSSKESVLKAIEEYKKLGRDEFLKQHKIKRFKKYTLHYNGEKYDIRGIAAREGANKRGNSSRLTQSFHFFMFEPIFSPVNALNQPI
ncbi:hypothetical protein ACB284_26660 [Serratia marcescens]